MTKAATRPFSSPSAAPRPAVHVLFVHGVGQHSRLSALMQAYQALRADPRSREAPVEIENPIPEWRLQEFSDGAGDGATPRLKLVTDDGQTVFFHEVNYSALAGVIRGNQPLDLSSLFVGFDLAVNVARTRLENDPPQRPPRDGRQDIDHLALARTAQKLAGVFVAATVPILGIPSLVFRRFTRTQVGMFTRFFEDIATFALDMNGLSLIDAHVDQTLASIAGSADFAAARDGRARDELVVVAHSLGSVVAHSHLVRHLLGGHGTQRPDRLLTFGSPIGLVCWLWLLIDFQAMDVERPNDAGYFAWRKEPASEAIAAPLLWLNVLNHLDPIATAFPIDHVALGQTPARNRWMLEGNRVHHRYIDTDDLPGRAHTAYFGDRKGFLQLLARTAGLIREAPQALASVRERSAAQHWRDARAALATLRRRGWAVGLGAIAAYLGGLAWLAGGVWWLLALLPLYALPPWTIGGLAFFQRLTYSRPTKRTSVEAIEKLPWHDPHSRPHRIRQHLRSALRPRWSLEREREFVMAPGPGLRRRLALAALSFFPSLAAMALPLGVLWAASPMPALLWQRLLSSPLTLAAGLALFSVYLIAFALSEFAAHWRTAIAQAAPEKAA